jgi:flagellar hook-basal body complex protein FliE
MEIINQSVNSVPEFCVDAKIKHRDVPGTTFSDVIRDVVYDVNVQQVNAGKAVQQMISGEADNIHDVMIAVEKARTSFDLLMEVRNKALDMYRELMRIQI